MKINKIKKQKLDRSSSVLLANEQTALTPGDSEPNFLLVLHLDMVGCKSLISLTSLKDLLAGCTHCTRNKM